MVLILGKSVGDRILPSPQYIIIRILDLFFSNFKWYRHKIGGTWYQICSHDGAGGIAGPYLDWRRKEEAGCETLKMEKY